MYHLVDRNRAVLAGTITFRSAVLGRRH
jgi:hypothetical protein